MVNIIQMHHLSSHLGMWKSLECKAEVDIKLLEGGVEDWRIGGLELLLLLIDY